MLRRLVEGGFISRGEFKALYREELDRLMRIVAGGGGNYYLTQSARVSRRFARAIVMSTLEGQTLHRDAFKLLGVKKTATFHEAGGRRRA